MEKKIIQVLLPHARDKCIFSYLHSQPLSAGTLVQVPFRSQKVYGIVWPSDPSGTAAGKIETIDPSKMKEICGAYSAVRLSESQIRFINFAANYNLVSAGKMSRLFLPFVSFGFVDGWATTGTYLDWIATPGSAELAMTGLGESASQKSTALLVSDGGTTPSVIASSAEPGVATQSMITTLNPINLNPEQTRALALMRTLLQENHKPILLEGVTSSGKTEVYLDIVRDALAADPTAQVLILLPEVMLVEHFLTRISAKLHLPISIWHYFLGVKDKKSVWSKAATGHGRVFIGSRSALFLPFKNLKLIVIDEEHDQSYKQEDNLVYHGRDMAIGYGHIAKIPVILASATPSIETVHNVANGKYRKAELAARYGSVAMPAMSLIDMKREPLRKSKWISESLIKATEETLTAGKQVMFFLNRKGYAPISMCRACGHQLGCKNCSASLIMYKEKDELLCHHCSYKIQAPTACQACGAIDSLIHCGPGIDRLFETAQKLWPEKKILRVTRDIVSKDEESQTMLDQIASGAVDIIIGTQILSKGYHFPNLHLVGIIDADIGLCAADLKASERTYQLLTQVAGRAGREDPGKVIVQTYYPDNLLLKAMRTDDKKLFYDSELANRKDMLMPPFSKLVAIIFSGTDEIKLVAAVTAFAKQLQYVQGIEALGPVPAPLAKVRKHYRYRFLIKSAAGLNVHSYVKQSLADYKVPSSIRVKVDVDPCSFL